MSTNLWWIRTSDSGGNNHWSNGHNWSLQGPGGYCDYSAVMSALARENYNALFTPEGDSDCSVQAGEVITCASINGASSLAINVAGTLCPVDLILSLTTLHILAGGILNLSSAAPQSGQAGVAFAYSYSPPAHVTYAGSMGVSATGLPTGLFCDSSGNVTGTPTEDGDFVVTFTVGNDADGKSVQAVLLAIAVGKTDQTITFAALPSKTVGDTDFAPGGSASSGLTVAYASSNTAVATIVSGNIHIIGAGTSTITASQAGDANNNAATPVPQTLTVSSSGTPSSNQTLNGRPCEFTADSTERIATLGTPGGYLYNTGTQDAVVNVNGDGSTTGLVNTTAPVGANNLRIPQGSGFLKALPRTCRCFNFAAASATTLQYIPRE